MSRQSLSVASKKNSRRAHCLTCRQIFRDNGTFQMHQKQGACQRFFCRVEDHEHQQVDETFETLAAAKVWIVQQQLDQAYVITSSFGDRKAYRCRFRGKPKSKPDCGSDSTGDLARERMVPPVVPALGCLSKILVDRMILCQCSPEEAEKNPVVCQNWASMVRVRGCLTHSHEMENQFLRMSRVCQDYLVSLLRTGMDKRSILKMYLNSDFAQGKGEFKCITAQDLRNLEKKYIKPNRSQNSDCADDEGESDAMVEGRDRARKDTEKEFQRRFQLNIDELRVHLDDSNILYQTKMNFLLKLEAINSEARLEKSVFAQSARDLKRKHNDQEKNADDTQTNFACPR